MPDELDLGGLRGTGLQEGEQLLPEESGVSAPSAAPVQADAGIVSQLVAMGFPEVRANKAAIKTGNSGAEAAMNWLLEHMDDPDIDQPLPASSSLSASSLNEAVETIAAMGFTRNQAIKALKATNNNVERAMDWIFSHVEELDSVGEESTSAQTQSNTVAIDTQPARYKLFAFISHIGGSTHTGHYVCHIKKDGKWIIYNDAKVAISEDTPKDMGYLYFYARV